MKRTLTRELLYRLNGYLNKARWNQRLNFSIHMWDHQVGWQGLCNWRTYMGYRSFDIGKFNIAWKMKEKLSKDWYGSGF